MHHCSHLEQHLVEQTLLVHILRGMGSNWIPCICMHTHKVAQISNYVSWTLISISVFCTWCLRAVFFYPLLERRENSVVDLPSTYNIRQCGKAPLGMEWWNMMEFVWFQRGLRLLWFFLKTSNNSQNLGCGSHCRPQRSVTSPALLRHIHWKRRCHRHWALTRTTTSHWLSQKR